MGSPFIWAGSYAKSLKSLLNLNDQVYIINGSSDPTSVAQNAPAGSIYQRTNGSVYVKTDAGSSTNWTIFSTGAGGATVTAQRVTDASVIANSGNTLPSNANNGNVNTIIVGTNVYLLGGQTNAVASTATDKIFVADLSTAPDTFTDTTKVLPAARFGGHVFRIGTTLYYVGGFSTGGTGTRTIYSASTATPDTWTDTTALLPLTEGRGAGAAAIIGSKAYIFGGYQKSSIVSASTSDLTTWSTEANSLPASRGYSAFFIAGNDMYIVGGQNVAGVSVSTIYTATLSAPTVWTDTGIAYPTNIDDATWFIIQNQLMVMGGETSAGSAGITTIKSAAVSAPTSFANFTTTLSTATAAPFSYAYNGILYVGGGFANAGTSTSGLSTIQKTSKYITVSQPTYTGIDTNIGGPSVDLGGQEWILSTFNKLGYAPWAYDATKPA